MNLKQFTDLVKTEREDIMRFEFDQLKSATPLRQQMKFFEKLQQCAEQWLDSNEKDLYLDLAHNPHLMDVGSHIKDAQDYLKRAFPVVPRAVSGSLHRKLSKIYGKYAKKIQGATEIEGLIRTFKDMQEYAYYNTVDIDNVLEPIEEDLYVAEEIVAYLHKAVKALDSGKYQGEYAVEDFMEDFDDYAWRHLM